MRGHAESLIVLSLVIGCQQRAERPPDAVSQDVLAGRATPPGLQLSPTSEVYKVGGDVTAPRALSKIEAPLPSQCRESQFNGSPFIFQATITETGDVRDIKTLKAPVFTPPCPEWEAAYREALAKARYEPALLRGKPVATSLTVTVTVDFR